MMLMRDLLKRFGLIAVFVLGAKAGWAFDDIGFGARAPGMADAHVAIADDGSAAAYNPAGLIQLGQGEITTQFGEHAKGLSDGSSLTNTYLGYAQPLRRGYSSVGFVYQNFQASDLLTERTILFGLGRRLSIEPFGWRGIWSVGANVKQLRREYKTNAYTANAIADSGLASGQADPVFSGGTAKEVYTGDVGILYQFGRDYSSVAGLTFTNITRPDLSLKNDGDRAPMATKLGLATRPEWGALTAEVRRTRRLSSKPDTDFAIGAERNVRLVGLNALTFRGGYAEGSRDYKALTAGLSYHFGRFRFDYAFKFPLEKLAETDGTHRLGFSMRLGPDAGQPERVRGPLDVDLLQSFEHDSRAAHVALNRAATGKRMTAQEREMLLQLLMRRYPIDDAGMDVAHHEYRQMLLGGQLPMDWPRLKFGFVAGAEMSEKDAASDALELLVKGQNQAGLDRLSGIRAGYEDRLLSTVRLMTLAELAAQAYRANDLDGALNSVRGMLEILPSDPMIIEGYRELMSRLGHAEQVLPQPELPEAPATLTGPRRDITAPRDVMEERARAFGIALGYYLARKSEGASVETLLDLLKQMRAVYGETGMDMSIVEREISAITNALNNKAPIPSPSTTKDAAPREKPDVTPTAPTEKKAVPTGVPVIKTPSKPAAVPAPKPLPATKPSKPVEMTDPALQRAWNYYKQAMERDVTDAERMEVLEGMRRRFGDNPAIMKEIEKIRKRLR